MGHLWTRAGVPKLVRAAVGGRPIFGGVLTAAGVFFSFCSCFVDGLFRGCINRRSRGERSASSLGESLKGDTVRGRGGGGPN